MVLRSLDNSALHNSAVRLAGEERAITARLLEHLREIERRRIYLEHQCGSLHEYCTKVLKYSEGAASRRVNASRLLDAVPEVAEKVVDGTLNLSTLSLAQTFIRAEEKRTRRKLSAEKRREVVRQVEGVSQTEALRQLSEAMPEAEVRTSSTRPLKGQEVLLQIIADPEFMELYERVRELNSHNAEFLQPKGLFKALLEEHLNRHAPERRKAVTQSHAAAESKRKSCYGVAIEQALHARSGGQCEHVDQNGHRCTRRYNLQIDHVTPLSRGGTNDLANLQHLCRAHNLAKGNRLCSPQVLYGFG